MNLPQEIYANPPAMAGEPSYWDTARVHQAALAGGSEQTLRSTERALEKAGFLPPSLRLADLRDELNRPALGPVCTNFEAQAKRKRTLTLVVQMVAVADAGTLLFANDGRGGRRWVFVSPEPNNDQLLEALDCLSAGKSVLVWPHGEFTKHARSLVAQHQTHGFSLPSGTAITLACFIYQPVATMTSYTDAKLSTNIDSDRLSHLEQLEAESIHIMREVVAQAENPVMLYSVGKDSSVMLHLARKAFYPSPPPFPLLHVDTRWKFQAMYRFRDEMAQVSGTELQVFINPEGIEKNINPFDHGSALHTDVMKTQGLKIALDQYGYDVAFGGARRDEEKSRAKERVFSFRTVAHRWDPKNQRPELWNLYNGAKNKGESIRVFPLSNWTELDIWQYIYREQIPLVPLYFAEERPVVERDGMLMLVDDERMQLYPDEQIQLRKVRFRTLGCYPLTGAFESDADDLSSIVLELLQSRTSERQGRAIDTDSSASMEKKKQEGYF